MTDIFTLATPYLPPVEIIKDDLVKDDKVMKSFGICSIAIKKGKYRNNRIQQRRKLEATKNEFIDYKLGWWCKKINTIIKIKNNLIISYFKSVSHLFVSKIIPINYDVLMKELDSILNTHIIPEKKEISILPDKQIIHKINDMILKHFSSLKLYLDKYSLNKAIQHHTYFTKKGVYKYHSSVGKKFYLESGVAPWVIH